MTDTNQIAAGTDVFDVLATVDLANVDTAMPLIANGAYPFEISEMTREISEKTGGTYLLLVLKLADEAETVDGKPLSPGYPLRHIISLIKKEKYDPIANIAKFHEALGDKGMTFDPSFQQYIGQTLICKTKVEPEREDEKTGDVYPPQCRVASFVRPRAD